MLSLTLWVRACAGDSPVAGPGAPAGSAASAPPARTAPSSACSSPPPLGVLAAAPGKTLGLPHAGPTSARRAVRLPSSESAGALVCSDLSPASAAALVGTLGDARASGPCLLSGRPRRSMCLGTALPRGIARATAGPWAAGQLLRGVDRCGAAAALLLFFAALFCTRRGVRSGGRGCCAAGGAAPMRAAPCSLRKVPGAPAGVPGSRAAGWPGGRRGTSGAQARARACFGVSGRCACCCAVARCVGGTGARSGSGANCCAASNRRARSPRA